MPIAKGVGPISEDAQLCGSVQDMSIAGYVLREGSTWGSRMRSKCGVR